MLTSTWRGSGLRRGVQTAPKGQRVARDRYRRCLDFRTTDAEPLALRTAHHALPQSRLSSRTGVFLVESSQVANARRVGYGSESEGKRCDRLRLVVIAYTLARIV
jgi:hypothetical protein